MKEKSTTDADALDSEMKGRISRFTEEMLDLIAQRTRAVYKEYLTERLSQSGSEERTIEYDEFTTILLKLMVGDVDQWGPLNFRCSHSWDPDGVECVEGNCIRGLSLRLSRDVRKLLHCEEEQEFIELVCCFVSKHWAWQEDSDEITDEVIDYRNLDDDWEETKREHIRHIRGYLQKNRRN